MAKAKKGKVEMKSPLYAEGEGVLTSVHGPKGGVRTPNPLGYHTGRK